MDIAIWQIVALAFFVLTPVPMWNVLGRAGMPKWLAILAIIPLFALILIWILGFKRWPGDPGEGAV